MSTLDEMTTPTQDQPFLNIALRWGLYGGAASIVTSLVMYLLDINPLAGGFVGMLINFVIAFGILIVFQVMAVRQYRDKVNGGFVTFGKALLICLVVGLVSSIIAQIWEYIMATVIDPDRMEKMKQAFVDSWGDSMPPEALEKATEQFDQGPQIKSILMNGVLGGAFIGALLGLIVGAFTQRKPGAPTL